MRPLVGAFSLFFTYAVFAQSIDNSDVSLTLTRAAEKASVPVTEDLIKAFRLSAQQQPQAVDFALINVSEDKRVTRLSRYLVAKQQVVGKPLDGWAATNSLFSDFNWQYLQYDAIYHPITFDSPDEVSLSTVETGGIIFRFSKSLSRMPAGSTILVPRLSGATKDLVTVGLDSKESKLFWTGTLDAREFTVVSAATSQGCEIEVRSTPSGATVLFNGKEWPRKTRTRSVRTPGKYDVVVRMPGYKDWRDSRFLEAGASWSIDASLQSQ